MSTRTRLAALAVCIPLGLVLGFAASAAGTAIGGAGGVLVTVVLVVGGLWLGTRLFLAYRLPARCRAVLESMVDPDAGPPETAQPTTLPAADRWARALTARDWQGAAAVLDDGLTVVYPATGRRIGRRRYVRGLRQMGVAFPDLDLRVDEAASDPADPGVVWVRFTEEGRARRGPPIEATWWERWTLAPDAERVREVAIAGVTRVG